MSMDVVDGRILPVIDVGMSPALMWDESFVSADGAALACPLCGWANLHLDVLANGTRAVIVIGFSFAGRSPGLDRDSLVRRVGSDPVAKREIGRLSVD